MSEGTGEAESAGGDSVRTARSVEQEADAPVNITEQELADYQREIQERRDDEDRVHAANAAAFASSDERVSQMAREVAVARDIAVMRESLTTLLKNGTNFLR